ncbi:MAG: undecaprenyldiphospho-muramoylpentapeptide beta-N-acetylglucosaminyltransferase [Finegoldia magna]|nr:undecaprenyldiphospho-muramoylpentapeptide beta-N-acetylglucosaminyltransferase [Finegoldia magna]
MNIIVSGGGTGGHIYPAISLIEELKKRDENNKILYVGTEKGLESSIVPKLGIDFKTIHVRGIPRKINANSFKALKELFKGLKEANKILKDFKPDLVIGTGGYVSGPILYKATKTKAKVAFHEQNSFPGVTNRILSRYVDRYFVTFEESIKYFKNQEKAVVTGNPIRNRFTDIEKNKDAAIEQYKISDNKKVVFIFGGSNGSEILNKATLDMVDKISNQDIFEVILATGKLNYDEFIQKSGNDIRNLHIYPYIDDIDKAYSVSDLIVTSSGAITLAELSFLGKASILVPKAYTTENHQEHNARAFEKIGASKIILEKDVNANTLFDRINEILSDDKLLQELSENSKKMSYPTACKDIVDELYRLVEQDEKA